jgi:secreted PhoX family phosphatase
MKRREFVSAAAVSALQIYVMGCTSRRSKVSPHETSKVPSASSNTSSSPMQSFGPLIDAKDGLLDLPKGFHYVALQQAGDLMSDGLQMSFQPDGMACFQDDQGRYVLLRNHELGDQGHLDRYQPASTRRQLMVPKPAYNERCFGGVSRVVVDPKKLQGDFKSGLSTAVVNSHWVLSGTDGNCAGGVFEGGWVSCEETDAPGHGYAFLTLPTDTKLMPPRRLDSWGRFRREAIVHDPELDLIYMTEDHSQSCLYRFVPAQKGAPTGGGTLQALSVLGVPDTSPYTRDSSTVNAKPRWADGTRWKTTWVNVDDPQASEQTCRDQALTRGASRFNRLEGICRSNRSIGFTASVGGAAFAGQVFEYTPDPHDRDQGELVLRHEVTDRSVISCPDNLVMTPWDELLMAEDNYSIGRGCTHQHLRVMTRSGEVYDLARNRKNFPDKGHAGAEFTGACFSPDGRILFVNLQHPEHVTLAITGPWPSA